MTIKKITAADPEAHSEDMITGNLASLKALFPEAFTEGKIDFDVLRQLLGGAVDEHEEKYGLNWFGKRRARQLALTPSTGTLRPCPEDSLDWDTTQNIMIEGDNLEVLKLLQKSYAGKVKLIYIDPPYNTGKDFVYLDDYHDNIKNYLEVTRQVDSGRKVTSNLESGGRFHTAWLNMMYPRLKLASSLLRDDGVIFISIDDSEQGHLYELCNEIFGEENFINIISINMKNIAGASGGGEDKRLKKNIEYLLVYARNYDLFQSFQNVFNYVPINELIQQYREEGISWKYTSVLVFEGDKQYVGSTYDGDGNEIKIFSRASAVIKSIGQVMEDENLTEGEVYIKYANRIFQTAMPQSSIRPRVMEKVKSLNLDFDLYSIEYIPRSGKNKGIMYEQFYKGDNFRLFAWLKDVSEMRNGVLYKRELQGTFWDYAGETKNLTREGDVSFPNGKKPLALINRILSMDSDKDAIILDFFAGSGTTGHAILKKNSEDGGSRRYILIQLQEMIDPNNEQNEIILEYCLINRKPVNIAELTKHRLRNAALEVRNKTPLFIGDLGFRVFRLDTSNIEAWEVDRQSLPQTLENAVQHLKPGRSEADILYELLLKLGLDLCVPIEERTITGKTVHSVGKGVLLVCLAEQITREDAEPLALGIVNWHKELAPAGETTCVFRDSGFADDVAKSNLAAILQQNGIVNIRSL